MKVPDRQKLPLSGRDPTLTRLSLAFGTMAISAGVVGDGLVDTTLRALIDMTTHSRCTATRDRAHNLELLNAELMTVNKVIAVRAKDVGQLQGGPRHGFCFLLLDRFTVPMLETDIASAGLATACR